MRKIDPAGVCADFLQELDALELFYEAGIEAFAGQSSVGKNLSVLSEVVFHRGYVAFEAFVSAYFVGCVNRDASKFIAERTSRLTESLKSKWAWDIAYIAYSPPRHPSVTDVAALLDPEDRNVSFRDCATMVEKAQIYLTPAHADKFKAISETQYKVVDAAKAIRNCVAHQSRVSFAHMNECLRDLPCTGNAALLRRPVRSVGNVGSYLKSVQRGRRRVNVYFDEFRELTRLLT